MNERRTQLGVVAPDPEDAPEPEKALAAVAPTTKAPAETFSRHFLGDLAAPRVPARHQDR